MLLFVLKPLRRCVDGFVRYCSCSLPMIFQPMVHGCAGVAAPAFEVEDDEAAAGVAEEEEAAAAAGVAAGVLMPVNVECGVVGMVSAGGARFEYWAMTLLPLLLVAANAKALLGSCSPMLMDTELESNADRVTLLELVMDASVAAAAVVATRAVVADAVVSFGGAAALVVLAAVVSGVLGASPSSMVASSWEVLLLMRGDEQLTSRRNSNRRRSHSSDAAATASEQHQQEREHDIDQVLALPTPASHREQCRHGGGAQCHGH